MWHILSTSDGFDRAAIAISVLAVRSRVSYLKRNEFGSLRKGLEVSQMPPPGQYSFDQPKITMCLWPLEVVESAKCQPHSIGMGLDQWVGLHGGAI